MTLDNIINYGIIGFGRYAHRRLQPAFQKTKYSRLAGLSRRNIRSAETTAGQYDVPIFTDKVKELVSHPDIHAVIVASPPALHREHVLLAAKHKKHVLVEKPIASHAGEVQEMIDACAKAGVKLMAGFVMRFIDAIRQSREMVQSGKLGKIRYASGHFGLDVSTFPRAWLSDPIISTGGPVADLGSHLLDLLDYVLEKPVVSIQSIVKPPYSQKSIERDAAILMEWEENILGTLHFSFDVIRESGLIFHGAKGKLTLTDFNQPETMIEIVWLSEKGRKTIRIFNQNQYTRMIDHFSEAILFDKPILTPGETGLKNQMLIDRIYGR
ncbi:MAG: gfo/Idh/MocA family oxidoreductase [Calditrichaeota bacterium]|nr:Gfo/Idh/MocA family oxidoreductase [Calditrichota bacterium]RQV99086.1 MAG: gfo/Idh/MocA family oxidoreductase [Calditrichota bacterium]